MGGGRARGVGQRELRESRKTERRNSRRPGKMRIVCTHEGNYPSSPFPLYRSLSYSYFFRSERKRTTGEGERERERERESERWEERKKGRRTKFGIFADVSP